MALNTTLKKDERLRLKLGDVSIDVRKMNSGDGITRLSITAPDEVKIQVFDGVGRARIRDAGKEDNA